ncbi:hypothetical protein QYE76_011320 [Lolium multiflorum]|uniref:Arabidopsis retrotransposon Orf1 C-terminal domain-containing protein n=1 Tax=Lolium multiflorum TaxID=4521 RepID=A0AAD8X2M4_LOLMU|nr:hypothetical protein QYE76_011320 [Lolium multiflorum]
MRVPMHKIIDITDIIWSIKSAPNMSHHLGKARTVIDSHHLMIVVDHHHLMVYIDILPHMIFDDTTQDMVMRQEDESLDMKTFLIRRLLPLVPPPQWPLPRHMPMDSDATSASNKATFHGNVPISYVRRRGVEHGEHGILPSPTEAHGVEHGEHGILPSPTEAHGVEMVEHGMFPSTKEAHRDEQVEPTPTCLIDELVPIPCEHESHLAHLSESDSELSDFHPICEFECFHLEDMSDTQSELREVDDRSMEDIAFANTLTSPSFVSSYVALGSTEDEFPLMEKMYMVHEDDDISPCLLQDGHVDHMDPPTSTTPTSNESAYKGTRTTTSTATEHELTKRAIESYPIKDLTRGTHTKGKRTPDDAEELLAKIGRNHDDWSTIEPTPTPIVKKRGMIKLNDEDMREAKKSLKEKGIKPEDVKNLPPIEDICETIPPSSTIEDPLYPEGHPKRVEQDSQPIKTSAPSKKKKKKHKNVVESSEPVNDPNSISISDAETESGNEHEEDNDKNDTPDKEEIEKEPEKPAKNKKYTKEDFITEKHGNEREPWVQKQMPFPAKKLKSKEEEHYNKFCDWMKPLFLQIPLTDAIKLPPYSKYMKDIVTNKRKVPNEEISTMLANYSFNGKIPKKLGDPGIPTIPCSIKNNYVRTALCDLGAGVSVMPFSLYKRLDLDKLIPTDISLQMADKSTAIPVGLCENVPVQVTQHCLILTDFVVLEMPEDDNMSIILGRPFLNTAGAVIDCNKGMVTFNVDDKEHTVYFPKRIDKKGKMKKFKFGELFKKATTSTGRPSRASTQIRRSYNEDVIAPSFAPEEDQGAPNASSFPCYEFLTNAGLLDDFFTLVNRAGLATYVGDERGQYYRLTKIFVESFKFHNTEYEPTVAFKIYDIPVTMKLEEFCFALGIAPVGTARRIDDNPRDLLELYRGITGDDCRTIQRGKIRNIQLPAIKYFAYYIGTSILGRENTSNISSYHLAFLNVALTGETPYHLGSLIARRLSSRGPIFGGTIASRILTHLDIPLDSNDVPLTPRKLDIAAMKSHHFVTTNSTIDNIVYKMLFADGNEKEIPLPQQGLFNIDRQSWSLTKEVVEEHMKIQEFHQQHDSENAEPSYDYTVTYPDVSSSTYMEPGRSSSYYEDTTSWGPWE